jgi:hypothetical protein
MGLDLSNGMRSDEKKHPKWFGDIYLDISLKWSTTVLSPTSLQVE